MSGFPILCVTDRTLCAPRFLAQVEAIAAARPAGLILREKNWPEADYQALASDVLRICTRYDVPCILHTFVGAAKALGVKYIHLPLPVLRAQSKQDLAGFDAIGVSCHSVAEASEAQVLGATYLTAGHIFLTTCKPGLPGRGLDFLREVTQAVSLPVYAIGGITADRVPELQAAGAAGACLRSSLMLAPDPAAELYPYQEV